MQLNCLEKNSRDGNRERSGEYCELWAVIFYYLFMCVPVLYAHVCVQLCVLYAYVCVQLCVLYARVYAVVCLVCTCVCVLLPSQEDAEHLLVLPYSPETVSFTESRGQPFPAGLVTSKPHKPSQQRSQMCAEKAQLFT